MAYKTIVLKGEPIRKEGIASEAITPGHLLEFVPSGGDAGQLRKHTDAGLNASPMFAVEEDFVGDDIDTAYADGSTVQYVVGRPGDEIYAILADNQTIVAGDFLESGDNGQLRKHTAPSQAVDEGGSATYTITQHTKAIIVQAMEAKTTSGATARLIVQVV